MFDAAVRQDRDDIACILWIVAAESLVASDTPWRDKNLTTRFMKFFDELISDALDEIVQHGNSESSFGIQRGKRKAKGLGKDLPGRIHEIRLEVVRGGLRPSCRGMVPEFADFSGVRRALTQDFTAAAIVGYIAAPRSRLAGHPTSRRLPCRAQIWRRTVASLPRPSQPRADQHRDT